MKKTHARKPLRVRLGPGCVKTFNLRVEIPSRFRRFENRPRSQPLSGADNIESNSAHFRLVHVFTHPGSFSTEPVETTDRALLQHPKSGRGFKALMPALA